jgi:hypothetical protein
MFWLTNGKERLLQARQYETLTKNDGKWCA